MKTYFLGLRKVIFVIITMAMVVCCTPNTPPVNDDFLTLFKSESSIGLYKNGKTEFVFDKTIHQVFQSANKLRYYITDDIGTKHLKCDFEATLSINKPTSVHISLGAHSSSYSFLIIQVQENTAWLWDEANNTGLILTAIKYD